MKKVMSSLLLVVFIAGMSPVFAGDDVKKEIKDVLKDMISLLENNKHKDFMEKYMPPRALASVKKNNKFDQVVKRFKEGKSENLLKHLKKAEKIDPKVTGKKSGEISDDSFRKALKFKKIDGKWYLVN